MVLGAIVGVGLRPTGAALYKTNAVLLISPPQNALGGTVFLNDPDRYVLSQVSALQSTSIGERVASKLAGETTDSIMRSISILQRPKTDIVDVIAQSADAERSQAIANAYAEQYISDLRTRAGSAQGPEQADIDTQLTSLAAQLTDLEKKLAPVQNPNFPKDPTATLPPDPTATAERETVLRQYEKLLDTKSQLDLNSKLKVTSEIIQPALLPKHPNAKGGKVLAGIGIFGGLVLGFAAALIAARFSRMVSDDSQIEDLVGQPVAGHVPNIAKFPGPRPEALAALPPRVESLVDQLCVRAEANAATDGTLRVAVISSQRGAGASSLAVTMAGRFARGGASVVLVDADQLDPTLSTTFRTGGDAGIPSVLARVADEPEGRVGNGGSTARRMGAGPRSIFTSTSLPELRVLGLGPKPDVPVLRRANVNQLIERLSGEAQVLVIDGGSLLDAATTVQLAQHVDAIVLAIPNRGQRMSSLEVVARQLRGHEGELLPVVNAPTTGRRGMSLRPRKAEVSMVGTDDVSIEKVADVPAGSSSTKNAGTSTTRPRRNPTTATSTVGRRSSPAATTED
jgi:Mrp family chromosome partitioning ATPase